MKILVEYTAQLRQAAGTGSEEVEVPEDCTLQQLAVHLAEKHGDPLRSLILDAGGHLQPSLLLFVDGEQVRSQQPVTLRDGGCVSFLAPVSGG